MHARLGQPVSSRPGRRTAAGPPDHAQIALRVDGADPSEQLRQTFALPIRAQVQQILNETPMVDTSGRRGVITTIPAGMGEDDG